MMSEVFVAMIRTVRIYFSLVANIIRAFIGQHTPGVVPPVPPAPLEELASLDLRSIGEALEYLHSK
jgi:hypothetical protein